MFSTISPLRGERYPNLINLSSVPASQHPFRVPLISRFVMYTPSRIGPVERLSRGGSRRPQIRKKRKKRCCATAHLSSRHSGTLRREEPPPTRGRRVSRRLVRTNSAYSRLPLYDRAKRESGYRARAEDSERGVRIAVDRSAEFASASAPPGRVTPATLEI